jgi:hypothetical protein
LHWRPRDTTPFKQLLDLLPASTLDWHCSCLGSALWEVLSYLMITIFHVIKFSQWWGRILGI